VPDIRAYNRFSVFIAFFALVGIGLWWESAVHSSSARRKRLLYLGLAVVGSYSLYDQTLEARHLRNLRPTNELEARSDGEFIGQLEAAVPPGTWVYQLPISGFPVDPGRERMMAYDHARPYLWSYSLKWSWPSFSQQHNAWQESLERLEGVELLESLALSGFGLIWVDRLGYADNGRAIVSSLTGAGARELFPGRNSRYAVLDVSDTARKLRDALGDHRFRERQAAMLAPGPRLNWTSGTYGTEHNADGAEFVWSRAESFAEIRNFGSGKWHGHLNFRAAAGREGRLAVTVGAQEVSGAVGPVPRPFSLPVTLEAGGAVAVHFAGTMGRIDLPPGETRDLHFYVMDIGLDHQNQ